MFIISTLFLISFIFSVLYLISGKITISKISRFFLKIALIGQTYLILNGKILLESKTFEMNLFVCSWIVGIFSILIMRPFFKSLYTLFI